MLPLIILASIWLGGSLLIAMWYGQSSAGRTVTDDKFAGMVGVILFWPLFIAMVIAVVPFWLMYSLGRWMGR
jgi:hypothetical protein